MTKILILLEELQKIKVYLILRLQNFEDPEFVERLKSFKADLIVGANFTPSVGLDQIESARLGMIAVHFTPLPLHPGGSGIPQQMLNNEKTPDYKYRGGITCYRIEDDGTDPKLMDSDHVVAQNFTEYEDTHTFSTAVGELTNIAITTTLEGVDNVAHAFGKGMLYVGQEQRHRIEAERKITRENGQLRLESSEMTYRRAKATSNRPRPWILNPNGNGETNLFDPERLPGPIIPGTEGILVDASDGIVYNTTQGLIRFKTAQEVPSDGPKGKLIPASEIAEKLGWEAGTILIPDVPQTVT
jgi:methionyl-tRNA formyltransferase